jgi:hypothetical protein
VILKRAAKINVATTEDATSLIPIAAFFQYGVCNGLAPAVQCKAAQVNQSGSGHNLASVSYCSLLFGQTLAQPWPSACFSVKINELSLGPERDSMPSRQ